MQTLQGFILTSQWRDTRNGLELVFWAATGQGPLRIVLTHERPVCFISRDTVIPIPSDIEFSYERRAVELRTLGSEPVDVLYFRQQRDLAKFRQQAEGRGIQLHEADLKPTDRYLMERFVAGGFELQGNLTQRQGYLECHNPQLRSATVTPELRCVAIDIETSDLDGDLYSIAVVDAEASRVFMIGDANRPSGELQFHDDEKSLLEAFLDWLERTDPDVILGWNVVNFDLDYLERRCRKLGVEFRLARGREKATILQPQSETQLRIARVPGRVVLDGIDALRTATWSFERFDLEFVAQALLGRGKHIEHSATDDRDRLHEIRRMFAQDKAALAAYNLEDCRLALDIFRHAELIPFLIQRTRMTGLMLDRQGGSVAAFDNLYLPRLHRRGYVAPNVGGNPDRTASPGGFVMDSKPGLYDNVLVLDFKSLYPSIIRSFQVDPLGLADPGEDPVPGFLGAQFARRGAILPALIEELWIVRDEARRSGNAPLSQATKIIMNSFYGVLGSPGCRFFDARLASSITRRGHEIINRSREFIEGRGLPVIYGDTDSLFVLLGAGHDESAAHATGETLARDLNQWWRNTLQREFSLESRLEIEFETHYIKFLMPTIRGSEQGSKKRYAGSVRDADGKQRLVFKGLESVRSDWTPLAREFQRELYRRVFTGEPYEHYLRETVQRLRAGKLDEALVYRKRLRRPLEEYRKNVPPHVQAARKLGHPGRSIEYVITLNGPEPAAALHSQPDYEHYVERQLAPVADGILGFLGTRFDRLVDDQMTMF